MENTISDHIIAFLLSSKSTKIYRKILWQRIQQRRKGIKAQAFTQSIYRLRKKGILTTEGNVINVRLAKLVQLDRYSIIENSCSYKNEKLILSFDIPQSKKKTRDWLRSQIKYWDFKMIHQSLWLGSGPLPKEFNERLRDLGIWENVKIFKVRKSI